MLQMFQSLFKLLMYMGAVLTFLSFTVFLVTNWNFAQLVMAYAGLLTLILVIMYYSLSLYSFLFRKDQPNDLFLLRDLFLMPISFAQFFGQVWVGFRYRSHFPLPETYQQNNRYFFPLTGTWLVVNGGPDPDTSHSWDLIGQRFAYDFVVTDERGKTHRNDGRRLEDYYAFGAPVLAPADGVVVKARDGYRDYPHPGALDPFAWNLLGNYVIIRHEGNEYSLLAHIRRGSVKVKRGDHVKRGQVVGEVGNSGNSSEPHLHFHVQDAPHFLLSASLPVRFSKYRRLASNGPSDGQFEQEEWVEEGFPVRGERIVG
ncbi:MAG: Peptidase, M23/M37 family [Candidatus Carbobacillus altaicus]|uniref:Peptidase, M23/M37 family n=1 Tax=Candidatus Carbonibacillus altaicus TaxID=2163959 RepID=A0A2R6XZ51_9BACL|nr:MAG: Peptidase, M23/M37 family [Candidatus Carbobacillus altaicus]